MGGSVLAVTGGLPPCPECGYHGGVIQLFEAGPFVYADLSCCDCAHNYGTFKGNSASAALLEVLTGWDAETEE